MANSQSHNYIFCCESLTMSFENNQFSTHKHWHSLLYPCHQVSHERVRILICTDLIHWEAIDTRCVPLFKTFGAEHPKFGIRLCYYLMMTLRFTLKIMQIVNGSPPKKKNLNA